MSKDVALDMATSGLVATTTAGCMAGGEPETLPAFRAGRLRTLLSLTLSACAHAFCLLVLSIIANNGLENGAKPILVSLEMPSANDEQFGPPLAGPPRSVPYETNNPLFSQPIWKPAWSAPAHSGTVKKKAHLQHSPLPAESGPEVKVPAETMAALPLTDGATIPAMSLPSVTSAQDAGTGGQAGDRLVLEDPGLSGPDIAQPAGPAQAIGSLPAITLARPLYRLNPAPEYPGQARRRQLEGLVQLEVLVNETGQAAEVRVFASSGHELLDDAAAGAVRTWRFEPARRGGQPVAMKVVVPVRFSLR